MEEIKREEEASELRKQVLLAEEQRLNGEKSISIEEAREKLKNR